VIYKHNLLKSAPYCVKTRYDAPPTQIYSEQLAHHHMQDIEKFLHGFQQFQNKYFVDENALFDHLRKGQQPSTLVIACCDSRADPGLLLGCDPGDIFVIRNIANLVPPCDEDNQYHGVSAGIQFAVQNLGVKHIIVLGHSQCGGIHALFTETLAKPQRGPDYVQKWLSIAAPAKARVQEEFSKHSLVKQIHACELASILTSLNNLTSYPWLNEAIENAQLSLHGWYFDIQEGALYAYSPSNDRFMPLVTPPMALKSANG
jgi:carbonic anhydrase